jgi:recombination associated protein RdgC
MIFKHATLFRFAGEDLNLADMNYDIDLYAHQFAPCGATQQASSGWVPPRGEDGGDMIEVINGQWLMALKTETKLLPGAVVKERVKLLAAEIERNTGRKPGRKQTKELKEQATLELLPMAFTKQSVTGVWLSPADGLLVVDTASLTRADAVLTALVEAMPGLVVQALHTNESPAAVMADWLLTGEPAADFTLDRECELKGTDEMKSVVRYGRHPLDIDEVRGHIQQGKMPTRLAMTWNGRLSFVLTDQGTLRKIEFLDGVLDSQGNAADRFDADAAILTGELRKMIPDLIEALGGEHVPAGMEGGAA